MLSPHFALTDSVANLQPSHALVNNSRVDMPSVGAYNNGVLMSIDNIASKELLADWNWLVGDQSRTLMTTGFGDVLLWRPGEGVYFLEVQRAHLVFIDADASWVIDAFVSDVNVVNNVLRESYFAEIVHSLRPLSYGEVLILKPWLMLGGTDEPRNYYIGQLSTYLQLVAQTHLAGRLADAE